MPRALRLRVLLALSAVTLWVGTGRVERARRQEVDATRNVWRDSGLAVRHVSADAEIERESEPVQVRLLVARAFLADALQAGWLHEVPSTRLADEVRRMENRLEVAADWARDAVLARPLGWEGPLVLAGTRFLAAWRGPDDSLYRRPERWLEPLDRARDLAPIEAEPIRLEATVRLLAWPGASDAERRATLPVLARAFRDPETLRILLADWRAAAHDEEEFESILPDHVSTWSLLLDRYARERRWSAYCRIRSRWWQSVVEDAHREVTEGARQKAQGDPARARGTLLATLERLPVDRRTTPLLERALQDLPPGPIRSSARARLETWLAWALPLHSRGLASLSPRAFGRIASLAGTSLPTELEAGAWLAAGDERSADAAETRSDRLWSEEWGPYFLAKARRLLDQGRKQEAIDALESVHDSLRDGWTYRELAHRLGLRAEPPTAPESWSGTAWRWRGTDARMELAFASERRGLQIAIDEVTNGPSGWLLQVDGREDLCTAATAGEEVGLHQTLPVGIHWLEAHAVTPGRVVPGDVRPIFP